MQRRHFLTLTATGFMLTGLSAPARAADRVFYTPGLAEDAMAAGKVVFLDFWTNWCTTCAAQGRAIEALQADNPAYEKAISFITVDWDTWGEGDLVAQLNIPRRSTLVVLKGDQELGRIVAGTAKAEIKALMDLALQAALT